MPKISNKDGKAKRPALPPDTTSLMQPMHEGNKETGENI
jgi:hypothetical protein